MGGQTLWSNLAIAAMTTSVFAGYITPTFAEEEQRGYSRHSRFSNDWMEARAQSRSQAQLQSYGLQLVNVDRNRHGRSPLAPDPLLTQVAQRHAEDMANRNFFSHANLQGQMPSDRMRAVGGTGNVAENIAYQMSSMGIDPTFELAEVFQRDWMRSTGHRRNLLQPEYTHFGYGIAISKDRTKIYAVQLFR